MGSRTKKFRDYLKKDGILIAPGVYDCITAKLVEQAGFKIIYVSGGGVSKSFIGKPDMGLLTMSEMVDQVRRIALATNVPIINDADTGYGNLINVYRTVKEFEQAGSSGIHLEDQIFPKRCGHFEGKQLIPKGEMIDKIKTALDARIDQNFVIIARTDARTVEGFEAALERGYLYQEAGADVIFIESPLSEDELKTIPKQYKIPVMVNMVEGGKTPIFDSKSLQEMGFKIVIYPGSLQKCMMKVGIELLKFLMRNGTTLGIENQMLKIEERNQIIGLPDILRMLKKYR